MKFFKYLFIFSIVLNAQTISFNGLKYKTIKSPITGKIWLDRNLGAKRKCLSIDDKLCYGDYYQWGRKANGHEKISNQTISKKRLSIDLTKNGKYISVKNSSTFDWRIERNDELWRGKGAVNNVCPKGFSLPTYTELQNETTLAKKPFTVSNNKSAFANFLKIPSSGFRNLCLGEVTRESINGSLWTSSPYERESYYLDFNTQEATMTTGARAEALPVRCIKR